MDVLDGCFPSEEEFVFLLVSPYMQDSIKYMD
jgi:hypothetical protein